MLKRALLVLLAVSGAGCFTDGPDTPENYESETYDPVAVHPYKAGSEHAGVLDSCLRRSKELCTLNRMPTLGMEYGNPTVDEIMNHVLVSHHWMGQRFEQLLSALPPETLALMRSVTGFVITSETRPAHFNPFRGAIHIDPEFLWATPEERATVPQFDDYRSGYADDINAKFLWRYVKNDEYARPDVVAPGESRPLEDLRYRFAYLMFHELSHAADFFPPAIDARQYPTLSYWDASEDYFQWSGKSVKTEKGPFGDVIFAWHAWFNEHVTWDLYELSPLQDERLRELGQAYFWGQSALPYTDWSAARVADAYAADSASRFYAYSDPAEDTAVLVEQILMYHYFGLELDIAWADTPAVSDPGADDYQVVWGRRGHIGRSDIRERGRIVLEHVWPEADVATMVNELPQPTPLRAGYSWLDNLDPDNVSSSVPDGQEKPTAKREVNIGMPYR